MEETISHVKGSPIEVGRHMVFNVVFSIPRFRIDHYKNSHGLTIYSDSSHPKAIEVCETIPIWLRPLEKQIEEHLKLIRLFQVESEARRRVYEEARRMGNDLDHNLDEKEFFVV